MREYTRGGEGDWRPETNAGVRKRRVPGSRLVRRSSPAIPAHAPIHHYTTRFHGIRTVRTSNHGDSAGVFGPGGNSCDRPASIGSFGKLLENESVPPVEVAALPATTWAEPRMPRKVSKKFAAAFGTLSGTAGAKPSANRQRVVAPDTLVRIVLDRQCMNCTCRARCTGLIPCPPPPTAPVNGKAVNVRREAGT